MSNPIETHTEELAGAVLAVITGYAISEVALYAAISGVVGAFIAHYFKKLLKLIDQKLKIK